MPSKIKNSLLITFVALLILCALPIYFVVNYQKQFNTQAQGGSSVPDITAPEADYSDADYFEYKSLEEEDPFYNAPITSDTQISDQKFFLRKGQSLLIEKSAIAGCGDLANFKIVTTPRPAVLCKGTYPAIRPNPKCVDFVEICEFIDSGTTKHRIKEQGVNSDCISITKICLPSVAEVCSSKSIVVPTNTDGTPQTAMQILLPTTPCGSYKCIQNISTRTNFTDLKKDRQVKPSWTGYSSSSTTCSNSLKDPNIQQPVSVTVSDATNDACYDLTDYTGRVSDIPTKTNSNYEIYQGFLNNNKGALPIAPVSNISADKYFGNLDYSGSNTMVINENGELSNLPSFQTSVDGLQMKMLFINNENLSSDFATATPPYNNLQTKITFNQTQTYKNGQMLKAVLCQEDDSAYTGNAPKYKFNESYDTKCEKYFLETGTNKELLTKTYNSLPGRSAGYMPNSLLDINYFTQDTPERFTGFTDLTHKSDSIKVSGSGAISSGIYDNQTQASRSPYMFDKNGWLKLMVAKEPRLLREQSLINPINANEPICHNYDNNFYCHKNLYANFSTDSSWENSQLKHDLRFRLAFQIDDPDINSPSVIADTQYPNAVATDADIQKGNQAYNNNTGKYEVTVKVTNPAKKAQLKVIENLNTIVKKLSLTDLFEFNEPIGKKEDQDAESKSMFSYLVSNKILKQIVTYSAILMIVIFAFTYLMGLSKLDHQTLATMILKIAFVFGLLSPSAWELYYNNFAGPIVEGFNQIAYQTLTILSPQDLARSVNIPAFDANNIATYFYQSIDVITMIFNQKNHFKIMAIFFSYSYGFVYVFIIYYGFYLYLFATANAILMFILAKIVMTLLINILPLFLLCLFFNTTKKMLDNWFSLVLGYGLQQIFIIIAVAFFNIMIVYILKMILGYKICWEPVLTIPQGRLGIGLPFDEIVLFKFWKVNDTEAGSYIPSLFHILYFLILVYAMKHFVNFSSTLGANIADGISVEGIANAVKGDLTGNIASKVAGKAFNKLTKGMKDRLIDKISFGYSGELADKRINDANQAIDGHRANFSGIQNKLNELKNNDEFLSLSDDEKQEVLKEKANALAKQNGYENYNYLVKQASQSKQSTSTSLTGMAFDASGSYGKKYFGKATNAVIGKNLITGVANDTGDFSEKNLLNTNRRVSNKDIERLDEEIEKIKNQEQPLSEADTKKLDSLKIQRELIALQQNTWKSMDTLRDYAGKYGIEAALVVGAVGGAGAVVMGAVGGAGAVVMGAGAVAGGTVGGLIGGAAGGAAGGTAVGGKAGSFLGRGLGAVAGGLGGALFGAARGFYSGVGVAVSGLKMTSRIAKGGFEDSVAGFEKGSNLIFNKVNYQDKPLRSMGAKSILVPVALTFGVVGSAVGLGVGIKDSIGSINRQDLENFVVQTSFIKQFQQQHELGFLKDAQFTVKKTVSVVGGAVKIPVAGAIEGGKLVFNNTLAGAIEGGKLVFNNTLGSNYFNSLSTRGKFAVGLVTAPVYIPLIAGGAIVGSAYKTKEAIKNTTFAQIARDDAKYNLQQKLTKESIDKDRQQEVIQNFVAQIQPYLSRNIELNKLNATYQTVDYKNVNLGQIHQIIEDSCKNIKKQNSPEFFKLFAKLAQQEKEKSFLSTNIANLTSSTAGAVVAGAGYVAGYAMQSMQDYKKEAILEQKQQRAEKTINDLMNSFDKTSQNNVKEFQEQIKTQTTDRNSIKEFVRDLTTTSSETTYTDKAKLLLALQEYAKTIK